MDAQKVLPSEEVTVLSDSRETPSNVNRYLEEMGCRVLCTQLKVGDYILSSRLALERKTIQDFLNSILDQRIFKQLESLAESYQSPVLLLEGNPDLLFSERNIHPNAIRGALASISVDYRVPIIWTRNPRESASQIYWMAYREQVKESKPIHIRVKQKGRSLSQQQEFLVAGLPLVNSKLSKNLLRKFKTVKKVFSASEARLMKVNGLGKKKAKNIFDLLNQEYEKDEN